MSINSAIFAKTARQAKLAFVCLDKQLSQSPDLLVTSHDDTLAYLLHAATLFFLRRDQMAFACVMHDPVWESGGLQGKLRQLPSYVQLMALVRSQGGTEDFNVSQALGALCDTALGVPTLKAFRDYVLINGVPDDGLPFETPDFDIPQLCEEALTGWEKLNALGRSEDLPEYY